MRNLIVFIGFMISGYNAICQNVHENELNLIVKTSYVYKDYPTEFPISFSILKMERLDSLQYDSSFWDKPSVVYQITKNGGYYVKDLPNHIYTQYCCSSGDIEYSMTLTDSMTVTNNSSGIDNYLTNKFFKKSKSFTIKHKDTSGVYKGNYVIRFWIARVDYCVCNIYMDRIGQPAYNRNVAYLKKVTNVQKLNDRNKEKVREFVKVILR